MIKEYNYFLIYTDHHFNQVHKAIKYYNLSYQTIVLFIFKSFRKETGSKNWINKIKKINKFHAIYVYNQWSLFSLIYRNKNDAIRFRKKLKLYSKHKNPRMFTSIYGTDTSQLAYHFLRPKTYYLMDEGNASYTVSMKRNKKSNDFFVLLIRSLLFRKFITKYPKSITYFTKYNLPINKSDYSDLYRSPLLENIIVFDNKSVILLGSNIYQEPSWKRSIIKEKYYIEILKNIKQLYSNKTIYYYASRYEKSDLLKHFESLGYTVVAHQEPFEQMFPKMNPCAHILISFGSPILDNLTNEYKHLPKCIVIKLDLNRYRREKEVFRLIFQDFEKNPKLEILEVNISNSNKLN